MSNIPNRYKQLLVSVPKGNFYSSYGQTVPYRSDPYDIRVTTDTPNQQYGIFFNDVFYGTVTTDAFNIATINIQLVKGTNEIRLVNGATQKETAVFLTAKEYATWLAAEAQTIEGIDEGIEQVMADSRLALASSSLMEDVFGLTVQTNNRFSYDLETYRELLQELRTAYRHYGATLEGIERVVRAFLMINPLVYDRSFGPRWILGKDILNPKTPQNRYSYYSLSSAVNINSGGANVTITDFGNSNGIGTGILKMDGTVSPKTLSWLSSAPTAFTYGPTVDITGDGDYTVYGDDYFDSIISEPETFNIVAGQNDILKLSYDGLAPISITLTPGVVTAASIATDINAALAASPIYGIPYSFPFAPAESYDLYLSGTPMVKLNALVDKVTIYNEDLVDAAQTIFNIPAARGGLSVGYLAGSTTLILSASTDMSVWPDNASVDSPLKVIVGKTTFHPLGAPNAAASPANTELVNVIAVNKGTKTLTLAAPGLVYAHNADELVFPNGDSPYTRELTTNTKSITVNVQDNSLLSGLIDTDTFTVLGSSVPTNWIKTTNAGAPSADLPVVGHHYFDTDTDVPFDLNSDDMLTIPVPDEILNYKGFSITIGVWADVDDPSRPAPQTTVDKINVSFDNQVTYDSVSPTVSGLSVNALNEPPEYSRTAIVPPDATKMWLRIKTTADNGNLTIHKVRIVAPSSGLFIGAGTIPRNENKIKNGQFLYVWSRDELTANETDIIGITNTTQVNPGHIDKIAPDMAWLDKFDVSEFDGFGNSKDVKGYFTEFDWVLGTATNMELILRTPPRFTYIRPTQVSEYTQTLDFPLSPAYLASLDKVSDQDMSKAVMLEDGVPVPQDLWAFTGPSQVQILYTPSSTSVYTFTYNTLIQFETDTIDLGASFADYIWFADYYAFIRPEVVVYEATTSTGVQFDGSGIAQLPEHSNADQTTASLTEDTGLIRRLVPSSQWGFVDSTSISINLDVLNSSSIYELEYVATNNHTQDAASVTVELKSATSALGLLLATYAEVTPNTVVGNGYRYHQMRITLNGVKDINDVRVRSLLLKGLNIFGPGPVPVLNP